MNIKPITFSDEMIKVVRSGVKTQTSRVITNQRGTCPFGEVGDFMFCREEIMSITRPNGRDQIVGYYSDGQPHVNDDGEFVEWPYSPTWLRPREMPLRFCRTVVQITNVEVDSLQNMSEDNCKAEGVMGQWTFGDEDTASDGLHYKSNFILLWNAINGRRGYSWDNNPLVWVIHFKRIYL